MLFLDKRIEKLLDDLHQLIYPKQTEIACYRMMKTTERFEDLTHLDTSDWPEMNRDQVWGGHREFFWFQTKAIIPQDWDGQPVVYRLKTGREGAWDAINPQFMLYVNGKAAQGLDVNHREVLLTDCARGGEVFDIILSAYTGDRNQYLKLESSLHVCDRATEQYYFDIKVPLDVAMLLPPDNEAYITIIRCLNESLNLLDLRREHSEEYYASLAKAQEYIDKEFYDRHCGNSRDKVYCVGHTHIDVAWWWTIAVTKDKAARSFATVLELMRRFPEYIFMSSQPQLYQFVKENAPELYAEIKNRIAEGRWEPDGGMWVEADCNISSGEALIRQFAHGKRFFREEFGKDNIMLWLPDVFGYSAALPQIMDKCGIRYFMTTKISWNEMNKLPCDTFMWEGIDGTRILTHFIPTQQYTDALAAAAGKIPTNTTYNGYLSPSQVMGSHQRYQQKYLNTETLMSFGYGDGGGGPTKNELEYQRRMARGIPGCPQTVLSTAGDFFRTLEANVSDDKYLPVWVGELYFEYHRGTYTSMARNKKYNRLSEFTYQNAELYGLLDWSLNNTAYPAQTIRDGWESILLNQFHDILPGSSIKEVYDDSKELYESILKTGDEMNRRALQHIVSQIDAQASSLVVFNPNSAVTDTIVRFAVPADMDDPVVYDNGMPVDTQRIEEGYALFTASGVPSKGYKTFTVSERIAKSRSIMEVSKNRLENAFFALQLADNGQFVSLYDKKACRELLKPGRRGNVIMSYEDRPHNYDAWDINHYYLEKSWEVGSGSVEVAETGPVRATLKVTYAYLDSVITQYISLYADIPVINIRHEIDWKEKHILLKCHFPLDIHANEATYDIQFGNVTRPTHKNTSWDFARFEVCAHKWLDLSEDGYGVSILNDCKYGCNVHDGDIGLSMLRSPTLPNPDADKEHHSFTYSIYPHMNGWREAGTVTKAYLLNNPLTAVVKENDGGKLDAYYALVSCDRENVIIEATKQAEDGNGMILRLYECYNRRTTASLCFGGATAIKTVTECDMLENTAGDALTVDGASVSLEMKPYEIKTLRVVW